MRIERVTTNDAAELLKIYAPYVVNTAISFEYDVPTVEEFTNRIQTISAKYPYIKAVDEQNEIVGYAYAGSFKSRRAYDWAVETTIYVKGDKRRNGVGRMLYEALEKALKDMGILNLNACIAMTENEDEHLTKDSFYFHEKLGYHLVGTFHKCGYKFNKWYDMIWMEKMVGEHIESNKHNGFAEQNMPSFGEWQIK